MQQGYPTSMRLPDPGIAALFEQDARWQAWLDVEAALAKAEAELEFFFINIGQHFIPFFPLLSICISLFDSLNFVVVRRQSNHNAFFFNSQNSLNSSSFLNLPFFKVLSVSLCRFFLGLKIGRTEYTGTYQ